MQRIQGQRTGTERFHNPGDNYDYHLDVRYENRYVCASRTSRWQCPVEISRQLDGILRYVSNIREHNHPPPTHYREKRQLIMALKQRALQFFHLSAPEVYDRVCAELNDIAFLLERGAALMHIQRARVATVYALPAVMSELGEMLEGYVPANAIFQGHVAAEDGTFATIFASDDMINRLNRCSELHIKPTFQGHPAVCILCERRTAILYSAIWEFLLELVPDMDSTLRVVYGEYEIELISSLRRTMPWVAFRGCWHNFIKAVTHKWVSLGLADAPQEIIQLTWAIPLLPIEYHERAINLIEEEARRFDDQHENIAVFSAYLRNGILPIANFICVFNDQVRIYNIPEAFNRQSVRLLGGSSPSFPCFIRKLSILFDKIDTTVREHNFNTLFTRRAYQVADEQRICTELACFLNARLSLKDFLETAIMPRFLNEISFTTYNDIKAENARIGVEYRLPPIALLRDPDNVVYQIPQDIPPAYVANLPRRRQYQRRPYGNGENAAPPRVPRADGRPRAHREPPRGPRRRPPRPEPGPDPPPEPQPPPARPEPQPEPQQPPPRPEPQPEQQQPPPEPPLVPQPESQRPPPRPDLQPEQQQPPAEPPLIPQPDPQRSPARPDRQPEQQQPPPDPPLVPKPEPQRPPPGPEPEPDLRTEPQPNQHPDVQPHLHDNVNEIRAFDDQLAEDTEPPECRLCLLNLAKIVFIPCGHLAACLRCSAGMDITDQWNLESNPRYRSVCPLCKIPFDIKLPVS